jgi:hypothetical protein
VRLFELKVRLEKVVIKLGFKTFDVKLTLVFKFVHFCSPSKERVNEYDDSIVKLMASHFKYVWLFEVNKEKAGSGVNKFQVPDGI